MALISSKLAASLFVPMRDLGAGAAGLGSKKLTRGTAMRALVSIAALGLLALPAQAQAPAPAQNLPQWAYPVAPAPKPPDATKPIKLPGSTKEYTQAQIDNRFSPPDWYPQDHPP